MNINIPTVLPYNEDARPNKPCYLYDNNTDHSNLILTFNLH